MSDNKDHQNKNLPWIEKYRPKTMDEVSAQEETIKVLKKSMTSQNLPHLLFYGPPGTGKTSSILALARELYGPDKISTRVLELNASDDRGISVIREKVKNFAKVAISAKVDSSYPCPPYKIIILDEADSLTTDAQSALRRIMETYSKVTRFCLICNYVTRIIEPLSSRCAKFRFKPIAQELCIERIKWICMNENFDYEPEAITKLIKICKGDLRKAIMFVQSAYQYCSGERLTSDRIDAITGVIPNTIIDELIQTAIGRDSNSIIEISKNMMLEGFPLDTIVLQVNEAIVNMPQLDNLQKAKIGIALGRVDSNASQGADELLQLMDLLFAIAGAV